MIISFAHKFAFVAIPKTGSQAIRRHLRPSLRDSDWEQAVLEDPRFFPVPGIARIGHGHIKVAEIEPFLLPGMWRDFYSFAFVRNPFDRFVSFCHFYNAAEMTATSHPGAVMKKMMGDSDLRQHVLMQPQHRFVEDGQGDLAVSFVGRYERLQEDFEIICARLGITTGKLATINASSRRSTASSFDSELADMVRDLYCLDFEKFGYDKQLPGHI